MVNPVVINDCECWVIQVNKDMQHKMTCVVAAGSGVASGVGAVAESHLIIQVNTSSQVGVSLLPNCHLLQSPLQVAAHTSTGFTEIQCLTTRQRRKQIVNLQSAMAAATPDKSHSCCNRAASQQGHRS